jgi:hypothetical protein
VSLVSTSAKRFSFWRTWETEAISEMVCASSSTLSRCSTGFRTWISSFWIAGQRTALAVVGKGRTVQLDRLG